MRRRSPPRSPVSAPAGPSSSRWRRVAPRSAPGSTPSPPSRAASPAASGH
jgi:hypothetical protein